MNKFLKNLGLSLALLAGIETAILPYSENFVKPVQAQETAKKGLLQLSIEDDEIEKVSISIDGQEIGYVHRDSPKIIKLNYGFYIIGITNYNSILDQKGIEIKEPTSRLEILINTERNIHFGDFTNFFNKDNDNFLDDVEQFFGTDDNNSQDNPGNRANFFIKKDNKDYIFYTQNYDYILTFSEAKTFEEDIKAYNNKIKELNNENFYRHSEISSLINKIKRIETSLLAYLEENEDEGVLKEELNGLEEKYKLVDIQVQKLGQEKNKNSKDFLSNSNVFWFNRNGNSLKIFYKKYEDKEWQDISAQPDFYKNLK